MSTLSAKRGFPEIAKLTYSYTLLGELIKCDRMHLAGRGKVGITGASMFSQ